MQKLLAKLHADFEKCLEGMTVEGLDWTPGRDMNSLCVLVVHVVGSARYWVGDVAASIDSKRNRDAEFTASGRSTNCWLLAQSYSDRDHPCSSGQAARAHH